MPRILLQTCAFARCEVHRFLDHISFAGRWQLGCFVSHQSGRICAWSGVPPHAKSGANWPQHELLHYLIISTFSPRVGGPAQALLTKCQFQQARRHRCQGSRCRRPGEVGGDPSGSIGKGASLMNGFWTEAQLDPIRIPYTSASVKSYQLVKVASGGRAPGKSSILASPQLLVIERFHWNIAVA